ncbi:MAG: tetratricopeptide repeat protein [Phycisphaerae bacterium]|nr:tetratricopeptide repeat protein [Phycisphaerae bacterium]
MRRDSNHALPLSEAYALLDTGHPQEALVILKGVESKSPELQNAYGVCLMRLGQLDKALTLFQTLVFRNGGVVIPHDVPAVMKTNLATALLLTGNVGGCLEILAEVDDENHPAVVRLRSAIKKWKRTLTFVRRFLLYVLGSSQSGSVAIDFPPGDLMQVTARPEPRRPHKEAA